MGDDGGSWLVGQTMKRRILLKIVALQRQFRLLTPRQMHLYRKCWLNTADIRTAGHRRILTLVESSFSNLHPSAAHMKF
jgi:hypothetical protein